MTTQDIMVAISELMRLTNNAKNEVLAVFSPCIVNSLKSPLMR